MTGAPAKPHDSYVRLMLDDPQSSEVFIGDQLVKGGLTVVPGSLVPVPADYVASGLSRLHADVTFEVRLHGANREPQSAVAVVLFEHKSAPDRETALQLLRYQVAIWDRWLEHDRSLPLPPVVSIVVHQGPPEWPHGTAFNELFAPLMPELTAAVPDFSFILIDLGRIDDSNLSRNPRLRAMLLALKYNRRRTLKEMLPPILDALPALSRLEIEQTLEYLAANPVGVSAGDIRAALEAAQAKGANVVGILELLKEDGLQEGLQKGREEGQAQALIKLLTKRFGPLPDEVLQQIKAAKAAQIELWFDASLDGSDLGTLFAWRP